MSALAIGQLSGQHGTPPPHPRKRSSKWVPDADGHLGARATRAVMSKVLGSFQTRERTPDPVRRGAVDVFDERARPMSDFGRTVEEMADDKRALYEALEAWHDETAGSEKGSQGAITRADLRVAQTLLIPEREEAKRAFDWFTGTVDLAISQIHRLSRVSVSQVKRVLDWFVELKMIGRQRRSIATGRAKLFGVPQRIETSCITFFTVGQLSGRLAELFGAKRAQKRAIREAKAEAEGKEPELRPLERRERTNRYTPELMNPHGWRNVLKAEAKALGKAAAANSDEEARAVAWATQWARDHHPKLI